MKKYFLIIALILILLIGVTILTSIYCNKEKDSIKFASANMQEDINNQNEIIEDVQTSDEIVKNNEKENTVNKNTDISKKETKNTNTSKNANSKGNTVKVKTEEKTIVAKNTQETPKSNKKTSTTNNKPTNSSTSINKNNTTDSRKNNSTKKQETQHKHAFIINDKWFKTNEEVERRVDEVFSYWDKKYNDGEITWDELGKFCPIGYETFRCSCGQYGLNFSYE